MSEHDHDTATLPPPIVDEVSAGVYAYIQPDGTWFINNCGFVVGSDQVVVIDTTSTEARTRAFIDAIREASDVPMATVVNTHHHGDHTHGNYLFEGATIVSHRRCRDTMVAAGEIDRYNAVFPNVEWGGLQFAAPNLTFEGSLELHAGDIAIELHDIGAVAHTDGDIVAWLPERGVLYTGDLIFHGGTPFALFGSVQGTIDAMARVESFGADVVVPGHGPVARGDAIAAAIADQRDYLGFVQQQAADGIAAGRSPLEQAEVTDLGRFADWTDSERLAGNLHVAYREADANPEFSIVTAIGDMIAFNGGVLPRCVA